MIEPRSLLTKLGLSEAETDVYMALLAGARAARDVVQATGRSRPTVYYALNSLERRGLLSKTGLEEHQRFRVEPLQRLEAILQEHQDELTKTTEELQEFVRQFHVARDGDRKPTISFYEGVAAVRNVIMETMYCHDRKIDSLVPVDNFFSQLGQEFVTDYVQKRHALGVRTRSLWGEVIDAATIQRYYDISEIRMLPEGLGDRFRSTVFMYDDCVLYISSVASGYALLVRSPEHYELMQMMYENLWQRSRVLRGE